MTDDGVRKTKRTGEIWKAERSVKFLKTFRIILSYLRALWFEKLSLKCWLSLIRNTTRSCKFAYLHKLILTYNKKSSDCIAIYVFKGFFKGFPCHCCKFSSWSFLLDAYLVVGLVVVLVGFLLLLLFIYCISNSMCEILDIKLLQTA